MEQRPDKPFDSKITIGLGDRGEDVVTIPPAGVTLSRLGPALFLLFWLGGWAVGVYWAADAARLHSTPWSGRAFIMAWLGAWLVGGIFVWASLFSMLVAMVGIERVAFDFDGLVHTRSALGFSRTRTYPIRQVSTFQYRSSPYGSFGGFPGTGGLTMRFGKRRIPVGHGVTDIEAEWLVGELNALLQRRKR
jgi:hypothetical protein